MKLENFDLTKTKEFRTWIKESESQVSSQEDFVKLIESLKFYGESFYLGFLPGKDCVLITTDGLVASLFGDEGLRAMHEKWVQKLFYKSYVIEDFIEASKDKCVVLYEHLHEKETGIVLFHEEVVLEENMKNYFIPKFGRTKFMVLDIMVHREMEKQNEHN
jgi:hypothetical protein